MSKEDDDLKTAVARYFGIDPRAIQNVEIKTDGGGHFIGVGATLFVPTGRGVQNFVDRQLACEPTPIERVLKQLESVGEDLLKLEKDLRLEKDYSRSLNATSGP